MPRIAIATAALASLLIAIGCLLWLARPAGSEVVGEPRAARHWQVPVVEIPQTGNLGLALQSQSDQLQELRLVVDQEAIAQLRKAQGDRLSIGLPTGPVPVRVSRLVRRGDTTSWLGQGAHDPTILFSLVEHEGALIGSIGGPDIGDWQFAGDGMSMELTELPAGTAVCGTAVGGLAGGPAIGETLAAEGDAVAAEGAQSVIDLTMAYTPAARQVAGSTATMEARIVEAVDRFNQILSDSGVGGASVQLLATLETTSVDEGTTLSEDLDQLYQNGDRYDDAHNLHRAYGADLLHLIVAEAKDGQAGLAQILGEYGVTALPYMTASRLTFVHEMGHNFGMRHAWGDGGTSSEDSASGRNYGVRFYDDSQTKYRTVMAYDFSWARIPRFSNVQQLYGGTPIGLPDGADLTAQWVSIDGVDHASDRWDPALQAGYDGSRPELGADGASVIAGNVAFIAARHSQPTIAVTAPDRQRFVERGGTLRIEWSDHPLISDAVSLDLYEVGGTEAVLSIADGLADNGSYQWTVPADLPFSENYYVLARQGLHTAASAIFVVDEAADLIYEHFTGADDPMDLAGQVLRFVPTARNRFDQQIVSAALPVDPVGGLSIPNIQTIIDFGFDSFAYELPLPWLFSYCGASYDSLFLTTEGYVVFGTRDSSDAIDLARFFRYPSINVLRRDLQPSLDSPTWRDLGDRVAMTWAYTDPAGTAAQAQIVLYQDGRIDLAWTAAADGAALVGLSPGAARFDDTDGDGLPDGLSERDLYTAPLGPRRQLTLRVDDGLGPLPLIGIQLLPTLPELSFDGATSTAEDLDPDQDHTWDLSGTQSKG